MDKLVSSYLELKSKRVAVVSDDELAALHHVGKFALYTLDERENERTLDDVGSITYGQYHDTDDPSQANIFICKYMTYSDYDNSCAVERSNHRVFKEDHPEAVIPIYGGYNTNGLAVRLDKLSPEMVEELAELHNYPVLDENDMSEMEMELQNEAWNSWAEGDFVKLLKKKFDPESEEDYEWPSENVYDLFSSASEEANEYWEIESGGGAYINLERIVAQITLKQMKEHGLQFGKMPDLPLLNEPELRVGQQTFSERTVQQIKARRRQLILEHKAQYGGAIQWGVINRILSEEYANYPQELKASRRRANADELVAYYGKIVGDPHA